MNPEELWAAFKITAEEAEAFQELVQILAERVRIVYEEMAAEILHILSALEQPEFETLSDFCKKYDKELHIKQRKQAREWEKAQAKERSAAAQFAQYKRQELK